MRAPATPVVLLVGPEVEENLGLRSLAASLEAAGVQAEILAFDAPGALAAVRDAAVALDPAIVAVSLAFQWRAQDALALALALREAGWRGHLTGGGHFATFAWRGILSDFEELDSLCLGEAEETLVELATAVLHGAPLESVHGLALRDAAGRPFETPARPPPDLARLPDPDRRGECARCLGHPVATLVASRGCYGRCAFCCIAAWHERARPGRRWRLRPAAQVAEELARLQREQGAEIFVFHDDNFLPPGKPAALERIHALADELAARGVGRIATVVKARPNDVDPDVLRALRDRLGLTRVFLGIESDSEQGLVTLGRGVRSDQNHHAMRVLADLGIYVCFNLLIWDPDTGFDALETNLRFMEAHADSPQNFGRVELYAGTPLLERMQREGRCTGDWMGWNYALATPEMQRVFELAMRCFQERNFAPGAPANRLMGTRFDVEVARHFHPERYRAQWLDEAKRLTRALVTDSVAALREIVAFVRGGGAGEDALVQRLCARLRETERRVAADATALEERVQEEVGRRCRHARVAAPVRGPGDGAKGRSARTA